MYVCILLLLKISQKRSQQQTKPPSQNGTQKNILQKKYYKTLLPNGTHSRTVPVP